jgi:hypothetical protein
MRTALRNVAKKNGYSTPPGGALLAATTGARPKQYDSSKPTFAGVFPATPASRGKRSRIWLLTLALPLAGILAFVHFRSSASAELDRRVFASSGFPPPSALPKVASGATADPPAPSSQSPVSSPGSSPVSGVRAATVKHRHTKGERAQPAAGERDPAPPAAVPVVAPSPIAEPLAVAPPVAPAPSPAPTSPPAAAPSPAPAPAAPAYDLQTARVVIGSARNAVGATPASVTRAVAEASSRITACYKAALPQLSGALEGAGVLHVDTDGAGIITEARLSGAIRGSVASCVAAAVQGHRVANVDTGSASGDVPLSFRAH